MKLLSVKSFSNSLTLMSVFLFQTGVILVQFLLLLFYTSCVFLFIGTCVLGLCISSVFPSMLAYTEDILNYKGKWLRTFWHLLCTNWCGKSCNAHINTTASYEHYSITLRLKNKTTIKQMAGLSLVWRFKWSWEHAELLTALTCSWRFHHHLCYIHFKQQRTKQTRFPLFPLYNWLLNFSFFL